MSKKIKELEHELNCMKRTCRNQEMDVIILMFVSLIKLIIIIFLIVMFYNANTDKNAIGQMVCDDNGHGEFIKFDSYNKIIECEPKPSYQEYDGGYIKVVDNAR